jgi:hypothetical protein
MIALAYGSDTFVPSTAPFLAAANRSLLPPTPSTLTSLVVSPCASSMSFSTLSEPVNSVLEVPILLPLIAGHPEMSFLTRNWKTDAKSDPASVTGAPLSMAATNRSAAVTAKSPAPAVSACSVCVPLEAVAAYLNPTLCLANSP